LTYGYGNSEALAALAPNFICHSFFQLAKLFSN
jgi:hypothetical protein